MMTKTTSDLNGIKSIIGRHEGRREKGHEHEENIGGPPRAR
jgi:hypothetical protein